MQLRQQVIAGGAHLAFRQGLGFVLNLAGITLLTKIVGPTDYGLYVIALGIVAFLTTFSGLGVGTYLIRSEMDPSRSAYQQALTFVLGIGVLTVAPMLFLTPSLTNWLGNPQLEAPIMLILPTAFLSLATLPSTAMIERGLKYQTIATFEISAQVAYFVIAVSLAAAGFGVYALVMGHWAQTLVMLALSQNFTRIRPQLRLSRFLISDMMSFGFSVSMSSLIWQSRNLVIPLLVARYVGIEATAMVNLATRLVEAMTMLRRVSWRLAVASFSKIQSDLPRLQSVLDEAMMLQILTTGPFLAAAGVAGPLILPTILGEEWAPALNVFPFVAVAIFANSIFNMQSAALQVRKRVGSVALFHTTYMALLAGIGTFLLPKFGVYGYAIAEMIALVSYAILHHATTRDMSVTYRRTLPWVIACMLPLFAVFIPGLWGALLLVPSIAIALSPPQLVQLRTYMSLLRRIFSPRLIQRGVA